MAFVADISGVCSSGGTREITWYPRNAASTNTYNEAIRTSGIHGFGGGWMADLHGN